MRNFIFLIITLLFSHFSNAQTLKFTLSDYTLLPKKPDGILHGISGIEYIPSKGQWHLASDRGNYFIFDSIKTIHDFEKRQVTGSRRSVMILNLPLFFLPLKTNINPIKKLVIQRLTSVIQILSPRLT